MERPEKTNRDFVAITVAKPSFGNNLMLKDLKKNIGLNYGSKKAIPLDNYVCFQVIANQSLNRSRIIGLKACPMNAQTTRSINT
jgi:hypothetical protein